MGIPAHGESLYYWNLTWVYDEQVSGCEHITHHHTCVDRVLPPCCRRIQHTLTPTPIRYCFCTRQTVTAAVNTLSVQAVVLFSLMTQRQRMSERQLLITTVHTAGTSRLVGMYNREHETPGACFFCLPHVQPLMDPLASLV